MSSILTVVAVALMDDAGRILVQQRPSSADFAGLWEFPGGKIEAGETPESALVREIGEELSIKLDAADLAPVAFSSTAQNARHLLLLLYLCRRWEACIAPDTTSAIRWEACAGLRALAMPPGDIPLIAALEKMSL